MLRLSILFLLVFLSFSAWSQIQTLGNNPSDIKWKVIKTPAANIIYADGMDVQAQRIANIIAYLDKNGRRSIGETERKIDLLVQNRTVIPNGYVALAPFRSEFYATPPQFSNLLGSMDWLDALTIHEYRHALQFMNMKKGLGYFAWLLTGDTGLALTSAVSVPNWYFEGDAVVAETSMSNAGRGRTADFTKGQRAMVMEDVDYTYMKWRNGSFRDFVPDHYRLGYMMLSHFRNEYGNDLSGEIAREGASWRKIIYPFSRSMRSRTGLHTYDLYRESWEKNKLRWKKEMNEISESTSNRVTEEKRTITNYAFPQFNDKNEIYAVKESYKETAAIVQVIEGGKDEKIVDMGINIDNYFDMQSGSFVWTEFATNGRRSNESFSNILIFENGIKKQLTNNGKYFSPIFFEKDILAIRIDALQNAYIEQLGIENSEIKRSIVFQSGQFISRLCQISSSEVAYLVKENNRVWIEKIDLESKKKSSLFGPTQHTIDGLEYKDGRIYFASSLSGIDNIYSIDSEKGQDLRQLTSVKIAAADPDLSSDGKSMIFNQFSTNGKYISTAKIDLSFNASEQFLEPIEMQWQDKVAAEMEGGNILDKVPTENYEVKDYKGLMRGMRLHSWGIAGTAVRPGARVVVNNILDDASIEGIVGFNRNEKMPILDMNLSIARYFPIFDISVVNAGRSSLVFYDGSNKAISFSETSGGLGISIPWNRLNGNFNTNARAGISSSLKSQRGLRLIENPDIEFDNRMVITGDASVSYSWKRRMARQNLRPKKGFDVAAVYKYQFFNRFQRRAELSAGVYLPGVFTNHSLYVSSAYRFQDNNGMINPFIDDFQYARGLINANSFAEAGRFSLDYAMPLLYPDWGFAGLVYFKRIKINGFYDAGLLKARNSELDQFHSVGAELVFENNYFNLVTVPFGFQFGYVVSTTIDQNSPFFFNIISTTNF